MTNHLDLPLALPLTVPMTDIYGTRSSRNWLAHPGRMERDHWIAQYQAVSNERDTWRAQAQAAAGAP